jgi:hypothetical protein
MVVLDPVGEEGTLEALHGRALEAEVRVTPLGGVSGVTRPLGGDPHPAREGHLAVADEDLAMCPVVGVPQPPGEGVELLDGDAGAAHLGDEVVVHLSGAHRVEEHPDRLESVLLSYGVVAIHNFGPDDAALRLDDDDIGLDLAKTLLEDDRTAGRGVGDRVTGYGHRWLRLDPRPR